MGVGKDGKGDGGGEKKERGWWKVGEWRRKEGMADKVYALAIHYRGKCKKLKNIDPDNRNENRVEFDVFLKLLNLLRRDMNMRMWRGIVMERGMSGLMKMEDTGGRGSENESDDENISGEDSENESVGEDSGDELSDYKSDDHWMKARGIRNELKKFGVNPQYMQIYRAKKKAMESIEGSYAESFGRMSYYADLVLEKNEGSVSFLGFDGCHLKGPFGGVLLAAIGLDGNNGLFPVAFAVVESECKES
ncbi:UNVERIFIED_CONTAM: hypothetical protein Scaly_1909900 [Sesamum calycinum]|uniref:Uncharacterized protein n=1 Tax=Sesamum calycinum TaxID=2727403 RepID=A0AAW2NHM8_9LAMI